MSEPDPERRLRILLVDDEPSVAKAARMMLEFLGHDVTISPNGTDALTCFRRNPFDLVFTDFDMPGMKGDELARAIKAVKPGQPVVMITAYADLLPHNSAVDEVISKPFLMRSLSDAIARLVPNADKR